MSTTTSGEAKLLAGRAFGEVYNVQRKSDLHDALVRAVEASGGRVLYVSDPRLAPIYLGVQLDSDQRIGLLVYPFRIVHKKTKNRPDDEVRGQLRYGSEETWNREHPVGRDVAGVDVTMIVGVDVAEEVFVGLDARLWDPLPMGISFYLKESDLAEARRSGWHVWEKINRPGSKRNDARSPTNFETVIAFAPDRLLDYARLERRATSLRMDPPLRYSAARAVGALHDYGLSDRHALEEQFALSSQQILDIISGRNRLAVAVRGGVAEYHLEQQLHNARGVKAVHRLDADAMHDFDVTLEEGSFLRVECKNASPHTAADGRYRVEVQKTRASKNDPASRFYEVERFDVVAACLFSATGAWDFRFARTSTLQRHKSYPDRLAAIQYVDDSWADDLTSV